MTAFPRRTFLKLAGGALGAGLTAGLPRSAWSRPLGANDDIRLAVVGFSNKGAAHIRSVLDMKGVRIAALCDVDPAILAREVEALKEKQIKVFATTDARELLGRDDIDALLVATSTHWHALLSVWACQAGKDVYVEKPVSRTIWEGSKLVEAAARHGRIVQCGTQLRSDTGIAEAVERVRGGELGPIRWIHTFSYTLRESIGRRLPWYPDNVDYDLFCGPTPVVPLARDRLHYDWHWMWETGNGDMGNMGIHVLDIARRFGAHRELPRRILSAGGRYGRDDAAQTPNTQFALFDYGDIPVTFESRGLASAPGVKAMDHFRGIRTGVVVQCEGGYYAGYIGGGLYDNDGRQLRRIHGDGGATHIANFLDAMRSRRAADLAAPIETGHRSGAICHYANISYRLGETVAPERIREEIGTMPTAVETYDRITAHLGVHGVDLARQPMSLGRWVHPDAATDGISQLEGGDESLLARARFLLKETQRPGFAIPETA